jgi:hypothetical protein
MVQFDRIGRNATRPPWTDVVLADPEPVIKLFLVMQLC